MENFFKTDKKYGLIVKKDQKPAPLGKSIFMDDDDDDNDDNDRKKLSMKKQTGGKSMFIKKQVQLDIEKALTTDPHCYEYDEMYDQDHAKKNEEKVAVKVDVKPKYMAGLIKAAENRKKRTEIITEKKVQKEREAEGDTYDDKECFVTNAYREKLKERKQEEERLQREQALEELLESKGEKDYGAFYRHILNQQVGQIKPPKEDIPPDQKDEPKLKPEGNDSRKQFRPKVNDSDEEDSERKEEGRKRRSRSPTPRRDKGRRSNSRSPSHKRRRDDGKERHDRHVKRSDHRRRSPDSRRTPERRKGRDKDRRERRRSPDQKSVDKPKGVKEDPVPIAEPIQEQKEAETKPDKKAKRNIGESFEDARARYLARKAENSIKPIISKK